MLLLIATRTYSYVAIMCLFCLGSILHACSISLIREFTINLLSNPPLAAFAGALDQTAFPAGRR